MIKNIIKKCFYRKKSTIELFNPLFLYLITKNENCSICFEPAYNNEIIFPFKCTHYICFSCFTKWLDVADNISCPLCRRGITKYLYKKKFIKKKEIKLNDKMIILCY